MTLSAAPLRRLLPACVLALALSLPAAADETEAAAPVAPAEDAASQFASPLTDDPALEARVMALAQQLRCLVCQNESIAESHAPLALDLRRQVRELLGAGKSEAEVVDFLVARYGDFVLFRPPVQRNTLLLWFAPFLLGVLALGGLFYGLRRRAAAAPETLSAEERERAQQLLTAVPDAASDTPPRP